MKGILLAGGAGTRLYPLTAAVSKHILPVYDKPMVYYPLSTLMAAGIREILIISTPRDLPTYKELLGDGSRLGLKLSYAEQPSPDGLAQAFLIGEDFIGDDLCALALGDNIVHGNGLAGKLEIAVKNAEAGYATIFGYRVNDPWRFGIMEFDDKMNILSVEEKPEHPKSDYCIIGLYFYDNRAVKYAKQVVPSKRGELEITSLNDMYLKDGTLKAQLLGQDFAWFDAGTMDSLTEAAEYMRMMEKQKHMKISVPEDIAWRNGWIDETILRETAEKYGKSAYGQYLKTLIEL